MVFSDGKCVGFKRLDDVLAWINGTARRQISLRTLKRRSVEGVVKRLPSGHGWDLKSVEALANTLPPLPEWVEQPVPTPEPGITPPAILPARADNLSLVEQKLQAEVQKIKLQSEGIAHENAVKAGKYFRKADVWLELAHRSAVLYAGLQQSLLAAAPDIARAGQDDPARAEDLTRAAIEKALASAINEFSRPMTLEVETWTGEVTDADIDDAD